MTLRSYISIAAALFALACVDDVCAQETAWRYGPFVSGSLEMPASDVRELPGAPSCMREETRLDDVSGKVFEAGGDVAWRDAVVTDFEAALRISFVTASTRFSGRETIGAAADASGRLRDIVVEYQSDVARTELRFEPAIRWYPRERMMLSLGLLTAVPLSTTFDQRESLVEPAQATYGDGSNERAVATGPLSEYATTWSGITAGVGVDIRLAERVMLRPQLSAMLALGSPLRDVDWHPHEIRFGLGVVFGGLGESTPIDPFRKQR